MPVVPAPGRLRQVDCHTLKAKLRYSESPRLKTENNSNKTGTRMQLGWQIACLAFMKIQVQSPALCKPDIVGTPITTELRRWDKRIKNIRSSLAKAEASLDYMRSVKVLAAKPVDMSLVPRTLTVEGKN